MVSSHGYEGDKDKVYSTSGRGETFSEIMTRRLGRRSLLKGAAGASVAGLSAPAVVTAQTGSPVASPEASPAASPVAGAPTTLGFTAIEPDTGDAVVVPEGYEAVAFLQWGDPITAGAPEFDVANQTAESQSQQAGYNADWVDFLPLPLGSDTSDNGLLVVNHEYTNPELMFPGYLTPNPEFQPDDEESEIPEFLANPTQEIVDVELEAHGLTIVEVRRIESGVWEVVQDSEYNRRVTATTPMEITGPASGAELMKTSDDTTGTTVIGTLNNCAGGKTPWGTIITGEENFNQYFANLGAISPDDPVFTLHDRFGFNEEASDRQWENFHPRFDLGQEPNEPFRFGWGVEIDPFDPTFVPRKRTALGRNKHEGHTSMIAPGGQVAIYSGDDERFEYAYKFVSAGSYNPDDRAANMDLLDEGTLHVARFNDDGTGEWLPLVYGQGGLDESNGFTSQADVLIGTRHAADVVGATKMDRPEDFEANPVNKKVYLVCTNNTNREIDETNAANPRVNNVHGHIVEISETDDDHASTTFAWEMFILAGDPANGSTYFAGFDEELVSPISAPDNITFDLAGNIWISTDGNNLEQNDGLFAAPTDGEERGYVKQFFSAVLGAEVTGPIFTPDNTALFLSVQHPGEGGTYEEPVSTWPNGDALPRPSVVVIQATDLRTIGS
ncbi:MAG: PhoX family phosphatase [Chloroflexota bacterium]|nr:PhoX family phosphatase [Chloroflexota bacterium]